MAGYGLENIVKGETHGMAQMGGPVISTFACGNVNSPVLMPGETDCLIAMEISAVLRPGFMELLKKDGGFILAPGASSEKAKPENLQAMLQATKGFKA